MQHFSESDIREAKERVRQMRRRASAYIDEDTQEPVHAKKEAVSPEPQQEPIPAEEAPLDPEPAAAQETPCPKPEPMVPNPDVGEDQSMIILMLIFLLSQNEADNMLILALLYLLF